MVDNITPTNEQNRGIHAVAEWYKNSNNPFFYLAGYAGSGKTSIAKLAVEACGLDPNSYPAVCYAAYTGKASMVLRRKGMDATTTHGLIYRLEDWGDDDKPPRFVRDPESVLYAARLLVLDECSMINDAMAKDLISFGTKILVLGDPGQLAPVDGAGYFTKGKPHFFLNEIHRQALDSPIIFYAHEVREGRHIPFGDFGALRKIRLDDYHVDEFLSADQILAGTHAIRHQMNEFMLQAEGFPVDFPYMPGIKVICGRNYRELGLYNGMIGRTMDFVDDDNIDVNGRWFNQRVHIEEGSADEPMETLSLRTNMGEFEETWDGRTPEHKGLDALLTRPPNWRNEENHIMQHIWQFGYCITVHKSQGSQWKNLTLCDNGHLSWKVEERRRWLYTAMTRAEDTLDIVWM